MWDWDFAIEILPELTGALWVTIEATLLGMSLALMLGLLWALLRRARRLVAVPTFWFVEFIRSTPLLVQIYVLFFVFPEAGIRMSPLTTGVLALGLHYSAYTSEVYRAGIDSVPLGQWDASLALNMSRWHMWRRVILPQAIPPVIPALGNYLVAMFKETPLLAAITVLEILQTARLIGAETFRYLEPLTIVGLLFLMISLISSQLLYRLEARFGVR
jgi:polar amino acid transport system permease protein